MKARSLILMIGIFVCNVLKAQQPDNNKQQPSSLQTLEGYTQTIYYSEHSKERATYIANTMEEATDFFQQTINFTPKIKLYILSPKDWADHAAKPLKNVYGFPHNVDAFKLVIATEDNDFWRSFLPPTENLSQPMSNAVNKAYTNENGQLSMMPFFDLLAIHEMGHSYTSQGGLKMQRYWMSELFVNIMLHTFVAEKRPDLLPALETFPNLVIAAGTSEFNHTTLEDFEALYPTLGMGPKNYGWYQCKLHSAAKDIYNAGGKTVFIKLWKILQLRQEDMTDDTFAALLQKEVHPEVANIFLNWNTTK